MTFPSSNNSGGAVKDNSMHQSIGDLVGKRVTHLSTDDQGDPKWCNGTVICIKPNSDNTELVIRYDGYKTLYSFDYVEYEENLLKLIPLEPDQILGMYIEQKFTDETESDEWFENGKIISYNPISSLYTINYFEKTNSELSQEFDNLDDELLNVYETLNIDLNDDYVKHDIRFK